MAANTIMIKLNGVNGTSEIVEVRFDGEVQFATTSDHDGNGYALTVTEVFRTSTSVNHAGT